MPSLPARVRVAVVDDHRMIADALVTHLASEGFDVVASAASWPELLESPEYPADVTVLDLNLDDGIRVETKVSALASAGSAVVLVSRHAQSGAIARAFQAGALGFVPKSAPASELADAVRQASRGQRQVPDTLTHLTEGAPVAAVQIGSREHHALVLFASGKSIREVAFEMDATVETVKSYIKRARHKYRRAGIDLGTKILLRQHAIREGWLESE